MEQLWGGLFASGLATYQYVRAPILAPSFPFFRSLTIATLSLCLTRLEYRRLPVSHPFFGLLLNSMIAAAAMSLVRCL